MSATSCCLIGRLSNLLLNALIVFSFSFVIFMCLRIWFKRKRRLSKSNDRKTITVGFFHPYCHAGGGGERVLWASINAVQKTYSNALCIVYTGDVSATKQAILEKVERQFKVAFHREVEFVFLNKRFLVEAKRYPYFTLLFQSLASIILGLEALCKYVPDVYIDTMGYAFTLPLFKYLGCCRTACYVHYPTISTDMLEVVFQRQVTVNNRNFISKSPVLSSFKIIYYKIFAALYGYMGRKADVIMVNSTWTKGHILSLWKVPSRTIVVYPPCDTSEFERIPINRPSENYRVLSIAQFRPEKNHELQLTSFCKVLDKLSDEDRQKASLVLIGGCRDEDDFKRVSDLKNHCKDLDIADNVVFCVNLPFQELISEMENSSIALHSMWNEHFGIGIVEGMSAGLITVAHNSGGPKLDIVIEFNGSRTGFLADDVQSYADAMLLSMKMSEGEKSELRQNARASARRFSVQNFENLFLEAIKNLFK